MCFDACIHLLKLKGFPHIIHTACGKGLDLVCSFGKCADLSKLKCRQTVIDPLTCAEIAPAKFIILEMPLGREHKSAAPYIDLLIWIDTPPDIALARKLKEFTGHFFTQQREVDSRGFISWLHQYLDNYLRAIQELLQIQKERVAKTPISSWTADVILRLWCNRRSAKFREDYLRHLKLGGFVAV